MIITYTEPINVISQLRYVNQTDMFVTEILVYIYALAKYNNIHCERFSGETICKEFRNNMSELSNL